MPHCVIEHYGALASDEQQTEAMELALAVCSQSGIMNHEDIKVRAVPAAAILFGDGRTSFLHLTLSMLQGRTAAQKLALAEKLRDGFRQRFPAVQSISVDIRDMDPGCYKKSLV